MKDNYSAAEYLKMYSAKKQDFWSNLGRQKSLEVFRLASSKVPAYQKFLKLNKIKPASIKSLDDVLTLPPTEKNNYFRKFPIKTQALPGQYEAQALVMTSTTGSTGEPVYFPRPAKIDWQYSVLAEYFLKNGPPGPTLLINCFGMGVWIGGVITYEAFHLASQRGYPLTIISPGVNKKEIYHALQKLAPLYKNVILSGYPPLIKDIADDAADMKLNSSKINFRLLFAAESFTETFRDHVCKQLHIKNPCVDTLNIYGSAELGAMAFETPGAIFIRRLACKHLKAYQRLFGSNHLPTLAQFNPAFVNFQAKNQEILITANSSTPFVNYKIGDRGGVCGLSNIIATFKREGIDLAKEARKAKIPLLDLPFVYVYERSDFATKLSGAIIYPGPVRDALHSHPLSRFCTGKFLMQTKLDQKHNQFLEINVELRPTPKQEKQIEDLCQKHIVEHLVKKNAEYKYLYGSIAKKITPVIALHPYEHETYFKPGIKQRWVN